MVWYIHSIGNNNEKGEPIEMIRECEFAQRIGKTVKLRLQDPDGAFRNHYHRYKSEDKAKMMLAIFGQAVEQSGGCWYKEEL